MKLLSKINKKYIFNFIRNFLFIFILLFIITKCQENGSTSHQTRGTANNGNGTGRIDMDSIWIRLGDSKGKINNEMGRACVEAAEFSPNEEFIVSGSDLGKDVAVWETKTGKKLFHHLCDDQVEIVKFSPDNKYFLAGGEFKKIMIWNTSDWSLRKEIEFTASVEAMEFSHDGKLLAVGDEAGLITLVDASSFDIIKSVIHLKEQLDSSLNYKMKDINAVDFSPDDQYLVSGAVDGTLKIWFLPDMELIKTIKAHGNSIKSLRVSPKGNCIASASAAGHFYEKKDNSIKIWDFKSGDLIHTLTFPLGMEAVEFTPDGRFLFGAGREGLHQDPKLITEGHIYVYYIPDNYYVDPIKQVYKQKVFRSEYLNISKGGDKLVSSHEDGSIRLWDIIFQ